MSALLVFRHHPLGGERCLLGEQFFTLCASPAVSSESGGGESNQQSPGASGDAASQLAKLLAGLAQGAEEVPNVAARSAMDRMLAKGIHCGTDCSEIAESIQRR